MTPTSSAEIIPTDTFPIVGFLAAAAAATLEIPS
jgi:hypothetical protein